MNTETLLNYKATLELLWFCKKFQTQNEEKGVVISGTHITDLPSLSWIKLKYLQKPKIKVTGHIEGDQEQVYWIQN